MHLKTILNSTLIVMTGLLFILVVILDLFSSHGALLSSIKGSSDAMAPLFMVKDFYQYHFSLSGWTFGFATFLFPNLILYFILAAFIHGFYAYVTFVSLFALLFILASVQMLCAILNKNLKYQWELISFVLILLSIIFSNIEMQKVFLLAEHHGGIMLLSAVFLTLMLNNIKQSSYFIIITLFILNMLTVASNILFLIGCTIPLIIALTAYNIYQRKFTRRDSVLIYTFIISSFIGILCASYLRLHDFSWHSLLIAVLISLFLSILILPVLFLPKIFNRIIQYAFRIKIITYILLGLAFILLIYILSSQHIYHFLKLAFDKKLRFSIAGPPIAHYNYFKVITEMLKIMLFGAPLSITIWFKVYLFTFILSIIYLATYRFKAIQNLVPKNIGIFLAWFLFSSTVIVFFANTFSVGLHTFTEGSFNLRYFLIPIFLGSLIIGYLLFNLLKNWMKLTIIPITTIGILIYLFPTLSTINFAAYANQDTYNSTTNAEILCLEKNEKPYHLQYGLSNHWLAGAANPYLPRHMFINQIRINRGTVYPMLNNLYWYIYTQKTHQPPTYNFILVPNESTSLTLLTRYGKPDKVLNCGSNLYLWVYQSQNSIAHINSGLYQQIEKHYSQLNYKKKIRR